MITRSRVGTFVLGLFFLSGLAGLIYQSIWSHYLGLLLGHAAYAQTLVLAIFMGGMAGGAWLASRWSLRWHRLFLAYAVIEAIIGLAGLLFHAVFSAYSEVMHGTVLPALGGGAAVPIVQWGGAALLILPQSVLLGMTFPLMSAAFIRMSTRTDNEVLGGLYFANSLGAAAGALTSTFVLMPALGLPGTVATAGVLNVIVAASAIVALGAISGNANAPGSSVERTTPAGDSDVARLRPLLFAAAITGATSFVYEIVWVRMLNQVLGTTVHSFELMLTAFILGLALGGLYVRQRGPRIDRPLRLAADAQVLMGVAALASTVVFASSFDLTAWFMASLSRSSSGYSLYMLVSAVVAMLVMLPAAFFAGMTLPLFTVVLLRSRGDEADIGRVYASNTLGAIAGVFLAVHFLIPVLGLHLSLVLAGVADLVLGIVLYRAYARPLPRIRYGGALAAGLAMCAVAMLFGRAADEQVASGVFRRGNASIGSNEKIEFLRDGKTATVSVYSRDGQYGVISTNGKPDASLAVVPEVVPSPDEITMIMAGAMPLLQHPDPRRVAIIGWGSGLSTHTVLGSAVPESVVNVEIESAMVVGARLFGPRVARAYEDKRSSIRIEDARTYFSTAGQEFDVIISEPSNPWVSGVASLFTREFYAKLRTHLAEGGMLVQWIHTYEIDDALVGTMLAALIAEFPHVDAYATNGVDVLLIASERDYGSIDWSRISASPMLEWELGRVGLRSANDVVARYLGSRDQIEAFVAATGEPPHSDYRPTVSLRGPRARFVGRSSIMMQEQIAGVLPLFDALSPGLRRFDADAIDLDTQSIATDPIAAAVRVAQGLSERRFDPRLFVRDAFRAKSAATLLQMSQAPLETTDLLAWSGSAAEVAILTIGALPRDHAARVWTSPAWIDADAQPGAYGIVLRALEGIAVRSADAADLAEQALAIDSADPLETLAQSMRTFLAASAVLAKIASGDVAAAEQLMAKYGRDLGADVRFGPTMSYLRGWIDLTRSRAS